MKSIRDTINRIKKFIQGKLEGPVQFLRSGKELGKLFCIMFASLFLNNAVIGELLIHIPGVIGFLIALVLITILSEILMWLIKIILGAGSSDRIYFYICLVIIAAINLGATRGSALPLAIIMSLLAVVAVDLQGRCLWAFGKAGKINSRFGSIALMLSVAYMIFYGCFCRLDNWGADRVRLYLNELPSKQGSVVKGFEEYLTDGEEEVGVLLYGPGDDCDIVVDTVDLMEIVERKGLTEKILDLISNRRFNETPVAGIVYYPKNTYNCPTLFMVHGAHNANTPSYLGYEYIGRYLASNGYVVVSVDENIINEMNESNDVRAVLLLENIKSILDENKNIDSLLFGRIDEDRLALGGHSRGGEMVATAYLFNGLSAYPENGNVEFDYNFNISAIVAIAPTVDQYMPADHSVIIEDVNYLLLHGANDHDVHMMMGEKQYSNVIFTDEAEQEFCKASVYIYGANHGQFNTQWGRYDLPDGMKVFLNTAHFLQEEEQQLIAKAYIRTFLDKVLLEDNTYSDLLKDNEKYMANLPRTVYITNYKDSMAEDICSFEDTVDLDSLDTNGVDVRCEDMKEWRIGSSIYGNSKDEENYVLQCEWSRNSTPRVTADFPAVNLESEYIAFRIKDMMGGDKNRTSGVDYTIELVDVLGHSVSVHTPKHIYPKIGIQLYKQDVLSGTYEYKHQFQTVFVTKDLFNENSDFDFGNVVQMSIIINGENKGRVYLDDIFYAQLFED